MAVVQTSRRRDRYAATAEETLSTLARWSGVDLPVRLWDGSRCGPDRAYEVVLAAPWSLRALLLPPSDLNAGEAFVRGDVDVTGDLVSALHDLQRMSAGLPPRAIPQLVPLLLRLPAPPRGHPARARLHGRFHSSARDRAAIAHHYDQPEAFYEQFLDENLVYSCAYWLDPAEPLEAAQARKLDLISRKLRLAPGQRLLDIGCGWGSLLLHAAEHYGVAGVGVTLSRTQAEEGRRRVGEAGLGERVDIRLADYRELDDVFDAVASVGMVEHVGPAHLDGYARAVSRLVRPGGLFCNHGIVTGDPDRVRTGKERTFVSVHVFPDGGLVPAWRMVQAVERGGFEVVDVEQLRPHYALTLREWVRRLESNRDAAVAAAGEQRYRTWRLYMAASAVSFETRTLGVVQVLGHKPDGALPLGRAWMQPG